MKKFLLIIAATIFCNISFAQSKHPYYGGGHHTKSHGGNYAGSTNSHHKNGHYKNSNTQNTYGRHKKS